MKRYGSLSLLIMIVACQPEIEEGEDVALLSDAKQHFQALRTDVAHSADNPVFPEKVLLGKTLYFDVRLSKNNTQSCNTCHNLETFGVDNEPTSKGDLGERGGRNSPTVLNAALHMAQFWDGRAADVEEQAGGPILNPVEMNMPSKEFVVARLKSIPGYQRLFEQAYPDEADPITYWNLQKAIAAFERTLITPSRFDEYLKGDTDQLSYGEKKGLRDFIDTGCVTCHNGPLLGGNSYQKFPVNGTHYSQYTGVENEDPGRMEATGNEADKNIFKVPSLRNISKTGPYFHDGSVEHLLAAVKVMGKAQLNKPLTHAQAESIARFLSTLKADLPENKKKKPKMPE